MSFNVGFCISNLFTPAFAEDGQGAAKPFKCKVSLHNSSAGSLHRSANSFGQLNVTARR